jgi:poly-gamma-glutamate capsule biosynthesis protein CapA/YwtB (metallophosphatase superfamily)
LKNLKPSLVLLSIAALVVVVTECGYYFPLTPLSLDLGGQTSLPPPPDNHARLIFVGDTLLGDWGRRTIEARGYDYPFAATQGLIHSADLAVGNLEGPISYSGQRDASRTWAYRMKPLAALALRRAGFDLMDLANNHIRDCGDAGVRESVELLRGVGITPFGAGMSEPEAHAAAIRTVRGVRVAFLGYVPPRIQMASGPYSMQQVAVSPSRAGAAWGSAEKINRDLRWLRERALADVVIVSLHLGDRYKQQPEPFERDLARAAVDAGADAVIGHGTHVMGTVELHRGRPILYGLGNYAFGSLNLRARFSLLAALELDPQRKRLTRLQLLPLYTNNGNPWIDYQPKLMRGGAARRVLETLEERSQTSWKSALKLVDDPPRLVADL